MEKRNVVQSGPVKSTEILLAQKNKCYMAIFVCETRFGLISLKGHSTSITTLCVLRKFNL